MRPDPALDAEVARCADDPDRFNSVILARTYQDDGVTLPAHYWAKQREVCRSVRKYRTTAVPSGNGVGKSFLGAGLACWFSPSRPHSRAVVAAPTQSQLKNVMWSEIERAYASAARNGFPLGGKLRLFDWDFGDGWQLEGFGSGSVESKSGRHAGDLFAIIDEASGVPKPVLEAIDSLNPSRYVMFGNPLISLGKFYETCELSADNPTVNVIRIPSLLSPDIARERSPRGMADAGWLQSARHEYGEDSLWWASHVLAMFPTELAQALLAVAWLNLAAQAVHVKGGHVWVGVDLGEGVGGDPTVIVARDDNGVIGHRASNRWTLDASAQQVREVLDEFDADPARVVYDQTGIGADFDNRLRPLGITGAKGFKGARAGGDKFANLRSAAAWGLRKRLDPNSQIRAARPPGAPALWLPQKPFAVPADLVRQYRAELQGVQYQNTPQGEIALEARETFLKRLKHSPNFLDALAMTFAYPFG